MPVYKKVKLAGIFVFITGGVGLRAIEPKLPTTGMNSDTKQLFFAIKNSDEHALKSALPSKYKFPDINAQDLNGNTPLHCAESTTVLKPLLALPGINPNLKNNLGNTPLMEAVLANNGQLVKLLIEHKDTDPNISDEKGNTPLMIAVKNNNTGVATSLINNKKTDPTLKNNEKKTAIDITDNDTSRLIKSFYEKKQQEELKQKKTKKEALQKQALLKEQELSFEQQNEEKKRQEELQLLKIEEELETKKELERLVETKKKQQEELKKQKTQPMLQPVPVTKTPVGTAGTFSFVTLWYNQISNYFNNSWKNLSTWIWNPFASKK